MSDKMSINEPLQPHSQKRGRKPKGFSEYEPLEFYRQLFQQLKQIEKHHAKLNFDKAQILQIAQEQNIPISLAEIIISSIEMHLLNIQQRKTLEEIKERVS